MGISLFYSGNLTQGKSVDEVVSYVQAIAKQEGLRSKRAEDFGDNKNFKFQIPQTVIDNPDDSHWAYPNRERIMQYAQDARLPTNGRSYNDLCQALNSVQFTQVGVYLWVHELAEPLRFLFVEGDTELTELRLDSLEGLDRRAKPIYYVHFQRDSLATKTAYEHDPKADKKALKILRKVNDIYFGEKMRIVHR